MVFSPREYLARLLKGFLLILVPFAGFCGEVPKIGKPAPDFAVASVDGRSTIRLSDFRGRRVLIFNWATW